MSAVVNSPIEHAYIYILCPSSDRSNPRKSLVEESINYTQKIKLNKTYTELAKLILLSVQLMCLFVKLNLLIVMCCLCTDGEGQLCWESTRCFIMIMPGSLLLRNSTSKG